MSLTEIKALMEAKHLAATPMGDAMMKQIVWDDQWMGFDDEETRASKIQYASGHCFGGIMEWSVDLDSGPGINSAPPTTTDGSCGSQNGFKVCGGDFPGCCSTTGWCGTTDAYCGSGCQSGNCTIGGVSSDGLCGAQNNMLYCGDEHGPCCSSSGFCGDGGSYCGKGCQSGQCDGIPMLGSGPVYIDPSIYNTPEPVVQCYPPCTFIFPPWRLETATIITEPIDVLTIDDTCNGPSSQLTTKIALPAITTNAVDVWNVEWINTQETILYLTSSINFPAETLTVSGTSSACIWTYSPGPFPPYNGPSYTSGLPPANRTPPPGPPPSRSTGSVSVRIGTPSPTATPGPDRGHRCLVNCNPEPEDGGGSSGCVGSTCPPHPGGNNCVGSGCYSNGGGSDGSDSGPENSHSNETCASSGTASICTTTTASLMTPSATTYTMTTYVSAVVPLPELALTLLVYRANVRHFQHALQRTRLLTQQS